MPRLGVIPGYAETVARETQVRDAAFLGIEERVNGVEVMPFTLRHMIVLDALGSPFLWNREAAMEILNPEEHHRDIAIFLWNVSPQFRVLKGWRDAVSHFLFIRSTRKLVFDDTCKAIFDYLEEAFQDSPPGSGRKTMPIASFAAHVIDSIAPEYHWSENAILDIPFKRLFQYRRCIQQRTSSKTAFFNKSDKIRGDYLRQLNGQN